jgi:lipopolysaccharide transport system ATP-binding protein
MIESVIHVEGLGKRYRVGERERYLALRDIVSHALRAPFRRHRTPRRVDYLWALRDVSLDVNQGEVVGLIGRNGAGKTTLLKLLSRITRPTTGFAEIRGRVGSLLEVGTGFHPELTGRENIYLSGAILGMQKREIDRKNAAIVAFAEVERFLDTPLKHYSTGMQMRLAFAVAAHLEPEILLVDEVLAVGDIQFQKKCLGKMQDISRSGRTIVFVSHQMGQMRRLCERVFWIDDGQIRQEGPAGEVIAAYESSTLQHNADHVHGDRCFVKWSICGHDNILRDGLQNVVFHCHVKLHEPISQGHFGLKIFNDSGALMVGWGIDNLDIALGDQEILLRVPLLPLRPGAYSVICTLFNRGNNLTGGHLIEEWNAQPPLIVDTLPVSHPQDRWAGILNLPADLHVRQR